ncbi:class I SAM-dependent methyltransferase [Luteolibacter sp. GHJ8]|uniref:Class I SAM-dependent methyltransferase n=1 Tax=Luteolibacter rhizosphaerae TaxID=2989719 RepID=A0ABT3G780_9BACT|nr:class I SAM-dependent methyltransferase [Luteolibacter rhizosphaerae]MCW1915331.1 class I SAM-dependent methyltransferase [Luteolibacter rhizosphaerae]
MSRVALLLALACAAAIAGWTFHQSAEDRKTDDSPGTATSAPQSSTETPSPTPAPAPVHVDYTEGPASPDGIGKFFHGREISQVMGHPAIGWLERGEREQEEAPSKAIAAIDLKPGDVIADIGAGSGYYSFRISPKIPQGKVVAVDIQPEMLNFLKEKSAELGISNVQPHLGKIDDLMLPEASLDAALMVDAYHEFSHPREMLASLHKALKPGGRIFLLEFRGEDPRVPIKPLHKMTEAQARLELESAGFEFVSNLRPLPWQHFMIFRRP